MNVSTNITISIEESKEIISQYITRKYNIKPDDIKSFDFWSAKQEDFLGNGTNVLYEMKLNGILNEQK